MGLTYSRARRSPAWGLVWSGAGFVIGSAAELLFVHQNRAGDREAWTAMVLGAVWALLGLLLVLDARRYQRNASAPGDERRVRHSSLSGLRLNWPGGLTWRKR